MSTTLQYAIQMENDAEKFYADQAQAHEGMSIAAVFRELAKAEHRHAEKITAALGGADLQMSEADEYHTLYSDREPFVSEIRHTVNELEVYSQAMKLEEESINLYSSLLEQIGDSQEDQSRRERTLLEWLINEERHHFRLFDELRELIRLGEEHVEDAEFANPPEY